MEKIRESRLPRTTFQVAELRLCFSEIAGDVHYNRTIVAVEKRGEPHVSIVSVDDAKILRFIRRNPELLETIEKAVAGPNSPDKEKLGKRVSALLTADDGIR